MGNFNREKMRTFAFACATALVAAEHHQVHVEKYNRLADAGFYMKNLWSGCYQGLYGMGRLDERPSDDCFGEWIPEHLAEVDTYTTNMRYHFWEMTYEESKQAAYDIVDLIFLNDQECLFRKTFWDVRAFCHQEENCHIKDMLAHLQTNAFSLITQVSQAVAVFKQESWKDMDRESRGYALSQLGHSTTQIFTDLFDFDVRKIPENPYGLPETDPLEVEEDAMRQIEQN